MQFINKLLSNKYVLRILSITASDIYINKYVRRILFITPSVIITTEYEFYKAINDNMKEPDVNKHKSPTKHAIIGGLKGIIFSPPINLILGFLTIVHVVDYFDKNVSACIREWHKIGVQIKDKK
jgi:hypothetical protein